MEGVLHSRMPSVRMKSQKRIGLKFLLSIHQSLSFSEALNHFDEGVWGVKLSNSIYFYLHKIVHSQRGLLYLSAILLA